MSDPIALITAIRNSFPGSVIVYTRGGCWEFYLILKAVFPNAEPFYDHMDGHVYTKIDGAFYDIHGHLQKKISLEPMLNDQRLMKQVHRWMPRSNFRVVRMMDEDMPG